jgi:hypothetical protein
MVMIRILECKENPMERLGGARKIDIYQETEQTVQN